jgi:hypothetical protein
MKWIFSMLTFFKYSLVLISLFCLSACWPFEKDDKKSSGPTSLLPDVNKSLSSESPAGIWMLEMSANKFESFYSTGFEENSSDYSSDYQGYKFLSIKDDPEQENYFIINDCYSFGGAPTIHASWQLSGEILSSPKVTINEEDNGLFVYSRDTQGKLTLTNNLELSGFQSDFNETSVSLTPLDTGDPLVIPDTSAWQALADIILPKIHNTNIEMKGIKISDEINFAQAPELNIQLEASNIISNSNLDFSQLKCMSSISETKTITTNAESDVPINIESSNVFNTHFSNDTFVEVESLVQESITSNSILLEFDQAQDGKTAKYSNTCLEIDSCEDLNSFQQSILETKGHLSTTVEYSSTDDVNAQINLSISVK